MRWKRFWLPTRVTVYLHRTFRHQVCFVSWKVPEMNHCPLCGSRKPLWTDRQWAEQERVGPVGSDSVKVTPETCSVLSDTGNITTLCFLYKPFSLGLHRPYSYARARLFGSDSSSKATKDIYFSGVPKYKYKAFNSSAASPDRRCTSHNPTSNQPDWLVGCGSWNSFKLLHPAATKPRRRDSEGFQWETFNWNIELKQIESTLLDTSSP